VGPSSDNRKCCTFLARLFILFLQQSYLASSHHVAGKQPTLEKGQLLEFANLCDDANSSAARSASPSKAFVGGISQNEKPSSIRSATRHAA
jgi:hypothetical protein